MIAAFPDSRGGERHVHMPDLYWRSDKAFNALCNIVFEDQLVCLTGAGISRNLKRKADPRKTIPGWWELLEELKTQFPPRDQDREDVEKLLKEFNAPGKWLILAADFLRDGASDPNEFDRYVQRAVEVVPDGDGSTSDAHRAIAELNPRGILTFNYDHGHENVWSADDHREWVRLTYRDERAMIELLRQDFSRRFLLKAHGTLGDRLVLDFQSYRDLLVKNPTYRAFVGRLLTQFNLLIVGFGMSDPDFDEFLQMISVEIGEPVRQHVLLTKACHDNTASAESVFVRRRFGIQTLGLRDWSDIPLVLRDAITHPGDRATQAIENCVSQRAEDRRIAHEVLKRLSRPGNKVVSGAIRDRIRAALAGGEVFQAYEYTYSLGKLEADEENKNALFDLIKPENAREIVAHAILALDGKLAAEDTPKLENRLRKMIPEPSAPADQGYPDPDNRIPIYLAYLIAQNRRRTAASTASLDDEPMPFKVTISERSA
jgi:hypothetical protein